MMIRKLFGLIRMALAFGAASWVEAFLKAEHPQLETRDLTTTIAGSQTWRCHNGHTWETPVVTIPQSRGEFVPNIAQLCPEVSCDGMALDPGTEMLMMTFARAVVRDVYGESDASDAQVTDAITRLIDEVRPNVVNIPLPTAMSWRFLFAPRGSGLVHALLDEESKVPRIREDAFATLLDEEGSS